MRHLTNGNVIVSLPEDLRFERYLRDSFPGLVARLRGGFSERIAPEEVVQEALLRAWQLSAHGEEIRSLEPWMTVAAKNLARWRTLKAEERALEALAMDHLRDPADLLQTPSGSSLSEPLASALGDLSPRQGQIILLHYYADLSIREIANRLAVSEGAVKRTLHDARAELRQLVGRNQEPHVHRRQTMTGWHMAGSHPRQYEHTLTAEATYEGRPVAQLRCSVDRADGFGTLMQKFSAERFLEQRVRFSGALECEDVNDRVGLWMRVDGGPSGASMLAFDNMADRPIGGTTSWQRCQVVLDVPAEAQAIALGVLLVGEGEARVSDFAFARVDRDVETTGGMQSLPDGPQNLDFSEETGDGPA